MDNYCFLDEQIDQACQQVKKHWSHTELNDEKTKRKAVWNYD